MANKSRLLSNIINDAECGKVFNSIAKLNRTSVTSLPAATAVPNQSFATEHNRFGKPSTIHFSKSASEYLQYLRDLDHYIASVNMSNGKQVQPLKFALSATIGGSLRYFAHVLSGVFAFEAYAEGLNPWIYSLAYISFVFIDLAIVLAIGAIVFSSKSFMKELKKQ
jgi:hypothetical protein